MKNRIIKILKRILKIKSPSKEMLKGYKAKEFEEIGKYIREGFDKSLLENNKQ